MRPFEAELALLKAILSIACSSPHLSCYFTKAHIVCSSQGQPLAGSGIAAHHAGRDV